MSFSLTTDERPTSEPVPEVVGSATKYGSVVDDGFDTGLVPHVVEHVAVVHRHQADDLGHVERRAAAEADDAIGAVRLEGRRRRP